MPKRMSQRLIAATLLLAAAGCAPHASSSDTSTRSNRSVITEAEIPTTGSESALDMIQRLRPEYLRVKPSQTYSNGSSSAPPPAVFLNGQRLGELTDLRQIAAQSLSSVRYYSIEEGKRKFGMQYGGGVIEIAYRAP